MVYRFKFRVRSNNGFADKFVFTLEEGREIFLDPAFQPSPVHTDETCFFLSVFEGKATIHFLCEGISWNGKPAPKGMVELHPGHLIQCSSHAVEILECPENNTGRDTTRFLDLVNLGKSEKTEIPLPHSKASAPVTAAAPRAEVKAKSPFQPMPESALASPDSVARPEPGDTFDPDSFHSPFANAIHLIEPPPHLDPRSKNSSATALASVALTVAFAAIVLPHSPLMVGLHRAPASLPAPVATPVPAVAPVRAPVQPSPQSKPVDSKVAAFLEAVKKGDALSVRSAVEKDNLSQDFTYDEEGRSPFLIAASSGHTEIVRYLAERKADTSSIDFSGNTALMLAATNGHEDTVELLLRLGADATLRRPDGADALALAHNGASERIRTAIEASLNQTPQQEPVRAPASTH